MTKKKQANRFQIITTIVAFVALIFAPGVLWIFFGGVIGDDDSEKRKLAELPEFSMEHIEEYPSKFEAFYQDHTPFRAAFRNVWTRANFVLFSDSTSSRVITGNKDNDNKKQTWLFYDESEMYSPVKGVQGLLNWTEEEMERAVATLAENTKQMEKESRELYFFVAPNKENIYREHLPETVEIFGDKSQNEKMIELLSESFENVLYVKDDLLNAKKYGRLYSRQDTHWNELGAFYGFKALMKKIEPEFNYFDHEVEITEPHTSDEDLARFLGMVDYFMDDDAEVKYLEDAPVTIEVEENSLRELEISLNERPLIDKTVMIVGDSYRLALKPYLQKVYRRVITMVREDSARTLIDEYDPDIVILEAVERCTFTSAAFRLTQFTD